MRAGKGRERREGFVQRELLCSGCGLRGDRTDRSRRGVLMVLMGILMEMLMIDERGREEKDTLHPRMSVRG
jgi:hypothetical protein